MSDYADSIRDYADRLVSDGAALRIFAASGQLLVEIPIRLSREGDQLVMSQPAAGDVLIDGVAASALIVDRTGNALAGSFPVTEHFSRTGGIMLSSTGLGAGSKVHISSMSLNI